MRRADRLFEIVHHLRGRRLTTAAQLARWLEVSERTIYQDAKGAPSERRVRSLALAFWGDTWTLGAWCELRNDFRNFRLDRVLTSNVLEERFQNEAGKRLADYLRAVAADQSDH